MVDAGHLSSESSIRAVEQLCNLRVRDAVALAKSDPERADKEFREVIRRLQALLSVSESDERHSLVGSALKRWASVKPPEERSTRRKLLERAAKAYKKASDWRWKREGIIHYYPAFNELAVRVLLGEEDRGRELLSQGEESLRLLEARSPDIWNRIALGDAKLYRMMLGEGAPEEVVEAYSRAFESGAGANPRERKSVKEQVELLASLTEGGSEWQNKLLAVRDGLLKSRVNGGC